MISIVCPIYNEAESINKFVEEILKLTVIRQSEYEMIFINDGSIDDSLSALLKVKESNNNIRIISLSRNFGKEAALTVGLKVNKGGVVKAIFLYGNFYHFYYFIF